MPIRRAVTTRAASVLTTTLVGALLVGVTAPAQAARTPDARRAGPSRVVVDGHGYGHGRGMSQWGAEAAASRGVRHRAILGYYYPGTAVGRATGSIRVWIRNDVTNDVQVIARKRLTAHRVGGGATWRLDRAAPRAKRWRVLPAGDRFSVLEYLTHGWHRFRSVRGSLELGAGGRPVTLVRQGGRTAYRGVLRSVPSSTGNRITVNLLPLETYLRGVVPAETFASKWHPQALQAQAVAARTYAVYKRNQGRRTWDVDNTQATQVYGGASAEYPTTDRAVGATRGEIRTYAGAAAFTEFSASNGGWRAAGDAPYLTAAQDIYETSATPNHDWTVMLTDAKIEAAYRTIGDLQSIVIDDRDESGRVRNLTITGSAGEVTPPGTDFAARFGLKSTLFDVPPS